MPRYTKEFKQKILKDITEGHQSILSVSHKYRFSRNSIYNWMKEFGDDVEQYFEKNRKIHPASFKIKVVEELQSSGLTIKEIARKFSINISQVRTWERIYIEKGSSGFLRPKGSDFRGLRAWRGWMINIA